MSMAEDWIDLQDDMALCAASHEIDVAVGLLEQALFYAHDPYIADEQEFNEWQTSVQRFIAYNRRPEQEKSAASIRSAEMFDQDLQKEFDFIFMLDNNGSNI